MTPKDGSVDVDMDVDVDVDDLSRMNVGNSVIRRVIAGNSCARVHDQDHDHDDVHDHDVAGWSFATGTR